MVTRGFGDTPHDMPEAPYSSSLAQALAPGLLERFLRYVRVDTQSRRDRETSPSTPGQLELGSLLVGELKRYFRDAGWALHVDRSAQERARKVTDAQQKISALTGRPPTVSDMSQYLEISDEEVLDGLQTAQAYDAISLDAPLQGDAGGVTSRLDSIGNEDDRLELVDKQATIFAAAKHLPHREREVLFLRFGEDLTQTEIAELVGISQMQVSRLLRRSLQRLRELTDDRRRV